MDRFIDMTEDCTEKKYNHLKSNMDRFIVFSLSMLDNIKK